MAGTKSKFVRNNLNFYDATHNPSFPLGVWADCPLLAIHADPSVGYGICEHFTGWPGAAPTGTTMAGWTATQQTTGAVSLDTANPGGVLLIDSNSTTATQGLNLQYDMLDFKPAANKDIWFECRLKIVDTYDKCELFVGLAEDDTSIIATSAVSTANHIGFSCVTDNGVILLNGEKATAGATKACTTISEATYVRLGFKVNGVTSVDQWVDGVQLTPTTTYSLATANIPIVGLKLSFVCQSGGTNDPIMHVDYVKCYQLL